MTPKVNYFGVFELKPGVKSTPKNNLQVAYYFKTFFMLDEWEVCSHEYDSSLSLSLSIHDVWAKWFGEWPKVMVYVDLAWRHLMPMGSQAEG